jgi:ribosomal-protein-alanine N-acetyltransferase
MTDATGKILPVLEFRRVSPELCDALGEFFVRLKRAGDDRHFHPHQFTSEQARLIAHYTGQDLYYVLVADAQVLGYGMLRGWDEGYEVPSLGIALAPAWRDMGIGSVFMAMLHMAARVRGVKRVRLKVHKDNGRAIELYTRLGYQFVSEEAGQQVGYFEL